MPRFRWNPRYERRVRSSPERALRSAKEVTFRDVPIARVLVAVRDLPAAVPARRSAARPGATLLDLLTGRGYTVVVDEATRLLVVGIGQPWKVTGGPHLEVDPGAGAGAVRDVEAPGMVVVLSAFWALPAEGGCRLVAETRVLPTDAAAERAFTPYWRLVAPFSGLIRRELLAAAARRVERAEASGSTAR